MKNEKEHQDLEEKIYISTSIDFFSEDITFSGLPEMDIEIKKKQQPEKIEKLEKKKKNALF